MAKHCCDDMRNNIYNTDTIVLGDMNSEDKIVYYSSKFREYGIPVKDGNQEIASSYILIQYCPWCGKRLPNSKRDEWFEKLERLGYDCPLEQDIPFQYQNSSWYENNIED